MSTINRSSEFMTAAEAAEHLGVKRATLYAYVSRGLIKREPSSGRSNLYSRADVERLKARSKAARGHSAAAEDALRWGAPVLESAITRIDPLEGPAYRNVPLGALLEGASYEAVAELLWTGAPVSGSSPRWPRPTLGFDPERAAELLRPRATAVDAMRLALAMLTASDTMGFALPTDAELERARALILRLAASVGLAAGVERCEAAAAAEGGVAATLAVALAAPPEARAAIEAAMIVCADHELNVSSFTARVVASARADLHAVITAALSAFSGASHGTFSTHIEALLMEIERVGDVEQVVFERLRRGSSIPGFGHPFYPDGDPRLAPLLAHAHALAPDHPTLAVLTELTAIMATAGYPGANLDMGLVALGHALGAPAGSGSAIFAVGRAAGWVAHAIEQRQHKHLLRPTAKFTG